MNALHARTAITYFEWLAAVCADLGWSVMRSHDMLDDTRWSDLYEQGLTPHDAAVRAHAEGWLKS
jgi:hypothetical protein